MLTLTRRTSLLGLAAMSTAARVKFAFADAPTDQRFIVILLRGALDGLSAVVPYGDANLAALRPKLLPPAPGQQGGLFDLGGFYGLNPALPNLHALYRAGQLLPVHAVAGPYRTRSHFEAQDLLQIGADGDQSSITSGWLNRVLAELPRQHGATPAGLALGIGTPLLLQGNIRVGGYAHQGFAVPPPSLYARIAALNASDPLTGPAIALGLKEMHFDASIMSDDAAAAPGDIPGGPNGFAALAGRAGTLLAAAAGPRIAAFQLEGWDTHAGQVAGLTRALGGLDLGLANLKTALGPAWNNTMVLVMTEFGRTASMNGTNGTDHGTATVAFLLGGQVAGGQVRATWPGLKPAQLFQNRDLAPTLDIRGLAKGALAAHLNLNDAALARVFPGSAGVAPLQGLTCAA
jgi:uncharacterized protein (DUF1501 family)